MSGVSAGRLLMLTWKVIIPASSFETTTLVMSGAAGSSPIESGYVVELAAARDDPPSATAGRATRRAPNASRTGSRAFTRALSRGNRRAAPCVAELPRAPQARQHGRLKCASVSPLASTKGNRMAVLIRHRAEGLGPADYDRIAPPLVEKVKQQPGFVLHVTYEDAQGFVVAELWDSQEQHDTWFNE